MLDSFWGLQLLVNDIFGSSWNIYTILSVLKGQFIQLLWGQRVYRYNDFLDAIIGIPYMSVFRFWGIDDIPSVPPPFQNPVSATEDCAARVFMGHHKRLTWLILVISKHIHSCIGIWAQL